MNDKFKDGESKEILKKIYKESRNNEIKENGFKFSFGVSIIILGIISIFFNTNNNILTGISLSALLFTLIDAIQIKNNVWYIFPLSLLLIFCIYPDFIIVKALLDTKFNNCIVFISFGASICLNAYSSYVKRLKNNYSKLERDLINRKDADNQMNNCAMILSNAIKIQEICLDNSIRNKDLNDAIDELVTYAKEEKILASVKKELVIRGVKNNTEKFSIDEIQDIIVKSGNYQRNQINDKMDDFYNSHKDIIDEQKKKKHIKEK